MSPNPKYSTPRQSVVNSEGLWTKMFDPPRLGPPTPEQLDLTNLPDGILPNPVPSVMQAAGFASPEAPYTYHTSLMHGATRPTWDGGANGGKLNFFLLAGNDLKGKVPDLADPGILHGSAKTINASDPQFPAPTVRVPRGAIFHGKVDCEGPPPHTIHWHGIEPTPMNDGVGHCSFEVEGSYTYQWQPNFIGTYFYHCHRNTMMHFEYGLAGIMPIMPPDAYFASIDHFINKAAGSVALNSTKIGAGFDGKFRTAANLDLLPSPVKNNFPGYIAGHPVQGVNIPDPGRDPKKQFIFKTDPWAYTVPYDVECIWVLDDRSSQWSDNTKDAFATFPVGATTAGTNVVIGVNEGFHNNGKSLSPEPGNAFFAFNDFNADYWYVTGVPVAAKKGRSATLPNGLIYPAALNSGISGTRIDIAANIGQTVFIRCLNAAYNSTRVTFPVDVVLIEWDGRAMGVPPLNRYTKPIVVKAGTPVVQSTARRWGIILNSKVRVNDVVRVEFLDTRSVSKLTLAGGGDVLMTVNIPIVIH